MALSKVTTTLLASGFAAVAGFAVAVAGSATASADGLTTQTGGYVDYDGTQGSFDGDGTRGTSRGLTTQSSAGHSIVSDACFVKGSSYCVSGWTDPSTIAATSDTSDDPDSALDADGYQAAEARGPIMVAAPGTKATPGTTGTSSGGFYYPH